MDDGWTRRLVTGLAEHIDAGTDATWRPSTVYEAGETGIHYRWLPPGPDKAIALTPYTVADDPELTDTITGVQVRVRGPVGDPAGGDDLADAIHDLLNGARGLVLGGIVCPLVWRQSTAAFGPDTAAGADPTGRWERFDNYHIHAARPSAHRTD